MCVRLLWRYHLDKSKETLKAEGHRRTDLTERATYLVITLPRLLPHLSFRFLPILLGGDACLLRTRLCFGTAACLPVLSLGRFLGSRASHRVPLVP